jgi:hypothetical protein
MAEKEPVDRTRRQKYTSTRGVVAWFMPMPVLLQEDISKKMESDGVTIPSVPTYEVSMLGEETATYEYDEKSIEQAVADGDDDAQKLWDDYLAEMADYNNDYNDRMEHAIKILCMEVEGIDDKEWVTKRKALGFEVPKDSLEKKLYFIKHEFIGSAEDQIAIMQYPLRMTLERSGVLQAVESMFRELGMATDQKAEGSESGDEEE